MGLPAAKHGDRITAVDTHIVLVPQPPAPPTPTPLPHAFSGPLDQGLSPDVRIAGRPAATLGSIATNTPPHVPAPPGTAFQRPPANRGTIVQGSATVRINGWPAARDGDAATTCNDPVDVPAGRVVSPAGTVSIG